MSNSYELLIDHDARPDNAATIGAAVIDALVSERLILPEANSQCVLTGVGYPPGPRLREIYQAREHELRYWDELTTIGVKLHTDRYVNFYGLPVFEYSLCPNCKQRFTDNATVMDGIYECVGAFINDDRLDTIVCPSCSAETRCDRWLTVPDLGFCHFAIEFWNWPSFRSSGWILPIVDWLQGRTGRTFVPSWGHM